MSFTLPTESIDEDIYKGFWINHSHGLIIAFLALFISATAGSFWKFIRFLIHATGSTFRKQDGVYNQRQAILRNQPLAFNAVLDFCRLGYVRRGRARKIPRRILPVALIAFTITVASVAAVIWSSKILTDSGNEVLIKGRNCGVHVDDPGFATSSLSNMALMMQYKSQKCVDAFSYSAQCYREGDTTQNELCWTFARTKLPYTSDKNASCPFSEDICKSTVSNMVLDSGMLDSHIHLGLNEGPRFTLRHRTHCAPLKTAGFTDVITYTNGSQSTQVYRYGNRTGLNGLEDYVFSVDVKNERRSPDSVAIANYKVSFLATAMGATLELIKELRKPNASVSLLFLDSSDIIYGSETKDPWFSATTRVFANTPSGNESYFVADEPVSVMGCATERSYCNPTLPEDLGCINGFAAINGGASFGRLERAWPDSSEQSAMRAFVGALSNQGAGLLDVYYAVPNSPTLLSRSTILVNAQTATLPHDRWKDEREHLYKASLAAIQSSMVEHARGFAGAQNSQCRGENVCERIYHSQKIRSSRHFSFNAFLLGTILVVGCVLILISTFIEELLLLLMRHSSFCRTRLLYSHAEWRAGSTLQLQRLAYENLSLGTWTRTDQAIPVTEAGETLGVLDITDTKHARMVVPSTDLDIIDTVEHCMEDSKPTTRYSRIPGMNRF